MYLNIKDVLVTCKNSVPHSEEIDNHKEINNFKNSLGKRTELNEKNQIIGK